MNIKLAKNVSPSARILLHELQSTAKDAAENDNASFDKNSDLGRIEYQNRPTDSFRSQSLSMQLDPASGRIDNMQLKDVDSHSGEAVEFQVSTDGDLKTYSRSYSLGDYPGSSSHVTLNESTGTITEYSDDLQETRNHHEDAFFEQQGLFADFY